MDGHAEHSEHSNCAHITIIEVNYRIYGEVLNQRNGKRRLREYPFE